MSIAPPTTTRRSKATLGKTRPSHWHHSAREFEKDSYERRSGDYRDPLDFRGPTPALGRLSLEAAEAQVLHG